tara:strand:+ start:400 stop:714 length:315 start_codon:yes stop_codon:yes gene_type:complete
MPLWCVVKIFAVYLYPTITLTLKTIMKSTYNTLTPQEVKTLIVDLMKDYVGNLTDQKVKYEVVRKFWDINDQKYTLSGMTKIEAYYFNVMTQHIYDTEMVELEK